jgi:type III secretion system YscQ/HrcQ family protein
MLDRVVPERCAAIVIAAPSDPLRRRFVLELGSLPARGLVDRLVGAEASQVEAPLSQGEVGVVLYAAARLLGEVAGASYQVLTVITTRAALRATLGSGDLAFWPIHFEVAGVEGVARVWLPDEALGRPPLVRPHPRLGTLPLAVRLFRGRARLLASELMTLAPGDAIVLDEVAANGELFAAVEGSTRALFRCCLDGSRVVIQEIIPGREAGSTGGAMSEVDVIEGLERAGDVEVELTVDVARLRLRLADLARLRPGEVLGTAVEVGAHVRLRAGALDIAEGELIDIEGKLGVLVTAVFPSTSDATPPGDQ